MDQAVFIELFRFLGNLSPTALMVVIVMAIATPAGVVGLILILWSSYQKKQTELLETYRSDIHGVLDRYGDDLRTVSKYYDDNVKLVERYVELATDLKSVIILNTQTITRMCDAVNGNQFCPYVRLRKESPGRIVE